jgi:ABC-type transport system substrate-binding protein/antitoxin (DNA-binding transcriptional repressor) of toxin-antitoxin stability system
VLNFNLIEAQWPDGRPISFDDAWFSLEYRKLNDVSWSSNPHLVITAKGIQSFDAAFGDTPHKAPKPGEFYFPLVNKNVFRKPDSPAEATVKKTEQHQIGYGRYYMKETQENRFIKMNRQETHPYYKNLKMPNGSQKIDMIRMQAFPRARINRNEQFIEGRVHLLPSVTPADLGYIVNAYPDAKISRFADDSFSCFVFNCYNTYLKPSPIRRALNYIFRKKLTLQKSLGGEGDIISGPLPARNYFYNIAIPPYEDHIEKGIAILWLYRYWGLDIYESSKKVFVASDSVNIAEEGLKEGDRIVICKRNQPIAEIHALPQAPEKKRPLGLAKGKIMIPESFFAPLPENVLQAFEGGAD